jgi:hypothetical protein
MISCRSFGWLASVALLALGLWGLPGQAGAQILIYRITLSDLEDYNVDFYDGGYLVAPVAGGTPSLILVNRPTGIDATYTAAVPSGEFFIGLDSQNHSVATFTCRGRETSAMCAFGPVESVIRIKSSTFDMQARAARLLSGGLVAASSEGGATGPDGTTGFAQHSQVTLDLDEALTREANVFGGQIGDGISVVNAYLESNGFRPEDPVPQPPAP